MTVPDWLPPLLTLNECGGWAGLLEATHQVYLDDFVYARVRFRGRPVKVRRLPVTEEKEAAFWHLIQEGESEGDRVPSIARCERIGWVRALIESVDDQQRGLKVWTTTRRSRSGQALHWAIALPDFSYMVAMRDDGATVLLLTAFPVERERRRQKLERDYLDWVRDQARGTP